MVCVCCGVEDDWDGKGSFFPFFFLFCVVGVADASYLGTRGCDWGFFSFLLFLGEIESTRGGRYLRVYFWELVLRIGRVEWLIGCTWSRI